MKTVTFPVKGFNVAGCALELEKGLGKLPPIKQVDASYATQTVTITYDETQLSEERLRKKVDACGFACGTPQEIRAHTMSAAPPQEMHAHTAASPAMAHMGHAEAAPMEMRGRGLKG